MIVREINLFAQKKTPQSTPTGNINPSEFIQYPEPLSVIVIATINFENCF